MRIGITGASGYVGGAVGQAAELAGHEVVPFARRRPSTGEWRPFELGSRRAPDVSDLDALVHCAHDFSAVGEAIERTNLDGARRLLVACERAEVPVVLLSSMSAFDGARSRYGRVKRSLEAIVVRQRGAAVRAGVVVGRDAGGIFGSLTASVRERGVVPVPGGGHQPLYVSDVDAICAEVLDLAAAQRPGALVFGAHRTPVTLRDIVGHVADAERRQVRVVGVPWRLVHGALRTAEALGRPAPFRSDSLLSLVHPAPVEQLGRLDSGCADYLPLDVLAAKAAMAPAPTRIELTPISG